MKLNPQYVNGHKAPRYLCKVHHDSLIQRLVWWAFRRYLLNEDYYRVSRKYTGPRPRGTSQYSTLKTNATASRWYIEPRISPAKRYAASIRPLRVVPPPMDRWAGEGHEDERDFEGRGY